MQLDMLTARTQVMHGVDHLCALLTIEQQAKIARTFAEAHANGGWCRCDGDHDGQWPRYTSYGRWWYPDQYLQEVAPLPDFVMPLGSQIVIKAGLLQYLPFKPDNATCWLFDPCVQYRWMRSNGEAPAVIAGGSPLVMVAVGSRFTIHLADPSTKVPHASQQMVSGDALVLSGSARKCWFKVSDIAQGTIPPELNAKRDAAGLLVLRRTQEDW